MKDKFQKDMQNQFELLNEEELKTNLGLTPRKAHPFLKIGVPILSGIALVGISLGVGLPIALSKPAANVGEPTGLKQVPARREAQQGTASVSAKSLQIYSDFIKILTPEIFTLKKEQKSISYSPFDAFVNVAMQAYLGNDTVRQDFLNLLGNPTMEEAMVAVKEFTLALGTTRTFGSYPEDMTEVGGYSSNCLFVNPLMNPVKAGIDDVLEDLENYFYAGIIEDVPSSENITAFLEDSVPEKFRPLPTIEIQDPETINTASVSSYFVKRDFAPDVRDSNYRQYKNPAHLMDYTIQEALKRVDYLSYYGNGTQTVFEGDSFIGGKFGTLNMDVFYGETNLDNILVDVVNESYTVSNREFNSYQIDLPYFKVENHLELLPAMKSNGFVQHGGATSRVVDNPYLALDKMDQFSIMQLDYDGFYSASVTVGMVRETAVWIEGDNFKLVVDHPFVFRFNMPITVDGAYVNVPICFGEIVDPAYPLYQA